MTTVQELVNRIWLPYCPKSYPNVGIHMGHYTTGKTITYNRNKPVLAYGFGMNCLLILIRLKGVVRAYSCARTGSPIAIDEDNSYASCWAEFYEEKIPRIINELKTNPYLIERTPDSELDAIDLNPILKPKKRTYVAPVVMEFSVRSRRKEFDYVNSRYGDKWSEWYYSHYTAHRNKCGTLGFFCNYKRIPFDRFYMCFTTQSTSVSYEVEVVKTNCPPAIVEEIHGLHIAKRL